MNQNIIQAINSSFVGPKRDIYNIPLLINFLTQTNTDIDKICIVGTPYGLLLYLLFIGNSKNTLFIFYGNYPLASAIENLRKNHYVCLELDNIKLSHKENELNLSIVDFIASHLNQYSIPVYGQDTSPFIAKFINERFTLFEDGRISYISKFDAQKTKGFHVSIYNEGISSIIYTGLEKIPLCLREISTLVDIKVLWKSLPSDQQKFVQDIFGFNASKLNVLLATGHDTILFTRNYAKAGKCKYSEQVNMYKDVLSNYDANKVIIKPHPNDNVDYLQIFKDNIVLPSSIPAELIWLCDLKINRVVSVDDSSNIFGTLDNVAIDLYPEMIDKYNIINTRNNIKKEDGN